MVVSFAGFKLGLAGSDAFPVPLGIELDGAAVGGAFACRILANFASMAAILASVLFGSKAMNKPVSCVRALHFPSLSLGV